MNRIFAATLRASLAGLLATAPMSAVMLLAHRFPRPEHHDLPPRQIAEKVADRVGLKGQLDEPQLNAAVIASHFGFGAIAGAFYELIFGKIAASTALKGAGFGLMVWSVSYLGWIPAARLLPPATQHSRRRNALMIGAHLIWGISTALGAEKRDAST